MNALDVLRARCPSCRKGKVTRGVFAIRPRCPECGYDFHPEPGYYLGAMMVGFLATAILTVPPMIALKVAGADIAVVIGYPFVQFAVLGPLLLRYARILWLHLERTTTRRLDRDESSR
jgi:uncharacterized protein (DUF983 family)